MEEQAKMAARVAERHLHSIFVEVRGFAHSCGCTFQRFFRSYMQEMKT
jgi:hypothetical protein